LSSRVAISYAPDAHYPRVPPFHPSENYSEYLFSELSEEPNAVYANVRGLLFHLCLDRQNAGTPSWNPLGDLVKPGARVLIKPNLVISEHPLGAAGMEAAVTHGSVVRVVVDYVLTALRGRGSVVIGDSPINEVDFDVVTRLSGIRAVVDWYREQGHDVALLDLRDIRAHRSSLGVITTVESVPEPVGATTVDLGAASALEGISTHRTRSTAALYDDQARRMHRPGSHPYAVSNAAMEADTIVSLSKLKTHMKTGVSFSIKNFVGTMNRKEWLPHFSHGMRKHGGDRFPDEAPFRRRLQESVKDFIWTNRLAGRQLHTVAKRLWAAGIGLGLQRVGGSQLDHGDGNWHGNDTAWRMSLDACTAALYGRRDGSLALEPVRKVLNLVDGIVGGDRNGPLKPRPRNTGFMAASLDPVALDVACTHFIGFDPQSVPHLRGIQAVGRTLGTQDAAQMEVLFNGRSVVAGDIGGLGVAYEPAGGWVGKIEAGST